jgi:hypothetical protein
MKTRDILFQVGVVLLALSVWACGPVVRFVRDVHEEAKRPPAVLDPVSTPTPEPTATPEPAPEPVVLGAPADLKAVAGDEQVSLSWEAASGAVGYVVIRDYAVRREVQGTEYVWGELPNGQERHFAVRGRDARGQEGPRSEVVIVTPTAPPPVYRRPIEVRLKMTSLYRAAPSGHMGTGASVIITAELRDANGVVPIPEVAPEHRHQSTWRVELAGHAAEVRPGPPPRNCRVWWSVSGAAVQVATSISAYNAGKGFEVNILTKDDCCGGQGTTTIRVTFSHPGLGLTASQTYPYVVWDAPPFLPGRRWPPQRK